MLQITNSVARNALTIALLLTAATACKKNDAAVAVDTSMAMPSPMPAAAPLKVDGIETGKGLNADKTVKDDAHDFGVRDTVYVSAKTSGAGNGKLSAKVTYKDGQTVSEESQDVSTTGDATHEFHVSKKTAWPKGDYKVEVMLDGVSAGTKDFTVK